jgi:hypothetical protein
MALLTKTICGETPGLKFPWFIRREYEFVRPISNDIISSRFSKYVYFDDSKEYFRTIAEFDERVFQEFTKDQLFSRRYYRNNVGVYLFRFKTRSDLLKAKLIA